MAARQSPFPRYGRRKVEAQASEWQPVESGGHELVARLHMRMKPGLEVAGEARHALEPLEDAVGEERLSELRLLVTELLTNSVRHAKAEKDWITLGVDVYADAVRVEVHDQGPGFELEGTPQPHPDRPGGWGLCLVEKLSDRWGIDQDHGTTVWFEVESSTPARFATTG